MCNVKPSPGGRSKSLEEDDLDRIALITHYIGGVSKDTGKRQSKSYPKTYPKTAKDSKGLHRTDLVGHEDTRYDPTLQVERRNYSPRES